MQPKFILFLFMIKLIVQQVNGQANYHTQYSKELINCMESPRDTIYIQDRKKAEKLNHFQCSDTLAYFKTTTLSGEKLYISISNTKFITSKHNCHLIDTVFKSDSNKKTIDHTSSINLIDGRTAYGNNNYYPIMEISHLKIKWNKNWLSIPDSAYHNLYEAHLCLGHLPIEAYITKGNKLLFIYLYGSDGAGGYAVKFVFNRKKYLTRIVTTNELIDGYDFLDGKTPFD